MQRGDRARASGAWRLNLAALREAGSTSGGRWPKVHTVDAGGARRLSPAQGLPPYGLVRHPQAHRALVLSALLTRLNDAAKGKVLTLQEYFILAGKSLRFIFARPFYGHDVVQQMDEIGVKSLGIVLLTGLFTGMVLALQSSVQLKTFGATMYIGNLVSASMIRELGPVLAGLMVAGRVGSGIAAQLGSMRVTEQIDALNTLGTDPIKKLVTPRLSRR